MSELFENKGKQLEKAQKKQIKGDCKNLQKVLMKVKLNKIKEEDVEKIRQAKMQLESSAAVIL